MDEILNLIESVFEDFSESMKGPVKLFFGLSKIHMRY